MWLFSLEVLMPRLIRLVKLLTVGTINAFRRWNSANWCSNIGQEIFQDKKQLLRNGFAEGFTFRECSKFFNKQKTELPIFVLRKICISVKTNGTVNSKTSCYFSSFLYCSFITFCWILIGKCSFSSNRQILKFFLSSFFCWPITRCWIIQVSIFVYLPHVFTPRFCLYFFLSSLVELSYSVC
jgi:hypothetical protein